MNKYIAILVAPFALFLPCFFLGAVFGGTGAGSATGNVVQGLQYGLSIWIFATILTVIVLLLKPEKEKNETSNHTAEPKEETPQQENEFCDG